MSGSAGRSIESYPIRLFAADMAELFELSLKRFYALDAEGAFLWAENKPRIGRKSWSRDRVKAHFDGTLNPAQLTWKPSKKRRLLKGAAA